MSEENSTETQNFFDNLSAKVKEYNQKISESKVGQDLNNMLSDVNAEIKRLGNVTNDKVNEQADNLKFKLEDLQQKIQAKMKN